MRVWCCAAPQPRTYPDGGITCASCHQWLGSHGDALAEVYRLTALVNTLRAALSDLVESLPRCDVCGAPATHAYAPHGASFCRDDAPPDCCARDHYIPMSRARALLLHVPPPEE